MPGLLRIEFERAICRLMNRGDRRASKDRIMIMKMVVMILSVMVLSSAHKPSGVGPE